MPRFHEDEQGRSVTWGISQDALRFIQSHAETGTATLETGAGLSTLVFALKGCRHSTIVPDAKQVEKIKAFAEINGIDLSNVTFYVDFSQNVLPAIEAEDLAFVLIDGDHAFPAPFIDWYYSAAKMRIGGYVMVDDTHLWTGKVLKQFMKEDTAWEQVARLRWTSVFRKTAALDVTSGWVAQNYVARRSPKPIVAQLSYGLWLLRKGQFGEFAARSRDKFTKR
jgi:predicted O-methyltransferase YrrM